MEKGILQVMKDIFKSSDKGRKIQMLILMILIGVLIVMFTNNLLKTSEPASAQLIDTSSGSSQTISREDSQMEEILSQIQGVGKVKVMITYENTGKNIYAVDVNETLDLEEQKTGADRVVTKKNEDKKTTVVFNQINGQRTPLYEDTMAANVRGVLVVAEGANDPSVRSQILNAVRVLTGVELHKIAICPYK